MLGDINWLRPYLKLSTGQLQPLFDILKGDSDPLSVRTLTTETKQALELVNQAIQNQQIKYVNYDLPIIVIIYKTEILPTILWHEGPLLWLHLPSSPKRVIYPYYLSVADIIMGRTESVKYFGKEPVKILVPFHREQVQCLIVNDQQLLSCISFNGDIDNCYPPDKLVQCADKHSLL